MGQGASAGSAEVKGASCDVLWDSADLAQRIRDVKLIDPSWHRSSDLSDASSDISDASCEDEVECTDKKRKERKKFAEILEKHIAGHSLSEDVAPSTAIRSGLRCALAPATETEEERKRKKSTVYIKIPISTLFGPESTSEMVASNPTAAYKLIDGFPSEKDVRKRKSYVMSFDERTRNAEWVYEILNRDTLASMNALPVQFGNSLRRQGYDRGHLAAAANHKWCQEAYNDTFMFSNVSPQLSALNRNQWKALENLCRSKAKEPNVCNVHVYTGPLYSNVLEARGGSMEKMVPSHFFKVIIVENRDGSVEEPRCFQLPNSDSEYSRIVEYLQRSPLQPDPDHLLESMMKSIDEIERESGLKFVIRRLHSFPMEHKKMATWTGENAFGRRSEVRMEVRVTEAMIGSPNLINPTTNQTWPSFWGVPGYHDEL